MAKKKIGASNPNSFQLRNPRTRVRDSLKYREDMMHYLEKSPGMCSDRPGTTPKGLDLVVFPTCLREKERDTFGVVFGLVGR